ncbi:PREDICTED: G-protein coupled receptor 39, partial [Nanorana parkeri]|uniref:G-protein coupled receptor 39 n=1 Tax=Nanorana parkeri TaxID=125878 RepID=UPI000854D238
MDENPCADLIDHSHVPDFEVRLAVKISLTVLYGIILLAGIIGNSATIRTTKVLRDKGYLQKGVTDHMISLACSDLLVILLGMPVELYSVIWFPFSSTYGNVTCKIYSFMFEACSYATIFHVATLSFERYLAICHPFRFKLVSGTRAVKLMICFAWLTSVCVALPLIFAMGAEYPLRPVSGRRSQCNVSASYHLTANVTLCSNLHSKWTAFQASIFTAFVVYIVVLTSVAFMCRKMMVTLMVAKKGTVTVKGPPGTTTTNQMTKTNSAEAQSARKQTILFLGKSFHYNFCRKTYEGEEDTAGRWGRGHCRPVGKRTLRPGGEEDTAGRWGRGHCGPVGERTLRPGGGEDTAGR